MQNLPISDNHELICLHCSIKTQEHTIYQPGKLTETKTKFKNSLNKNITCKIMHIKY